MRIGVDIDGVLYQWEKTARYMLREVYPKACALHRAALSRPSDGWNYIERTVPKEAWEWLWTHGVKRGLFRYGHLYSGVIEAMERLSMLGKVIIVTHRPASAVNDTLAWLAYNRFDVAGVHILTNGENKACVEDLTYFIDDKPENIIDMNDNGYTECVLMRRPWNASFAWPGYAVDNLDEYAHLIRESH